MFNIESSIGVNNQQSQKKELRKFTVPTIEQETHARKELRSSDFASEQEYFEALAKQYQPRTFNSEVVESDSDENMDLDANVSTPSSSTKHEFKSKSTNTLSSSASSAAAATAASASAKVSTTPETNYHNQISLARKQKNAIEPRKKQMLETLLGLKIKREIVEVEGHTFVLKSLNSYEQQLAINYIISSDAKTVYDTIVSKRKVYLALGLEKFDNMTIKELINESNTLLFEERLSIIDNLSEELVQMLSDVYESKLEVKYPTTQEEVAEVASNIKK